MHKKRTAEAVLFGLFQNFQSAGGASLRALAAGGAHSDLFTIPELGLDDGGKASANQTQQTLACNLFTGADTQVTQDALALVTLDDNQLLFTAVLALIAFEALGVDLVTVGVLNEGTGVVCVAAALQAALSFLTSLRRSASRTSTR